MTALPRPATVVRRSTVARRQPSMRWLGFAAVAVVTLAVLLPVLVIVFTAFKPASEVNAYPPTLFPHTWTLDNFRAIFTQLPFGRLILNSFAFAGGVTVFALAFDALAAYALARLDFRGSKVLLIVIVASLMIPFQATLIPIYQLVSDLGWVNTFAARIDGASEWRIFRSVVLPNAVPALLTLGIFTFVNNWNDLLWPLVFTTDQDMGTITSGLTLLTGPGGIIPQGVMMAGALIAVLPLAVMFLLVQRRFIESVASTGLK